VAAERVLYTRMAQSQASTRTVAGAEGRLVMAANEYSPQVERPAELASAYGCAHSGGTQQWRTTGPAKGGRQCCWKTRQP
jgi:hypothetical protein